MGPGPNLEVVGELKTLPASLTKEFEKHADGFQKLMHRTVTARDETTVLEVEVDAMCNKPEHYSGGPHVRFPFGGEASLWILGFGAPFEANPASGTQK